MLVPIPCTLQVCNHIDFNCILWRLRIDYNNEQADSTLNYNNKQNYIK